MTFLLIARHDDPHLPGLIDACNDHGQQAQRLELGLPPDSYELKWSHRTTSAGKTDLSLNGVSPDSVTGYRAVLCLPFAVNNPAQVDLRSGSLEWEEGETSFGEREWNAVVMSMLWLWQRDYQGPWITGVEALTLQDRKLALLHRAIEHGIAVPDFEVGLVLDSQAPLLRSRTVAKAINAYQEITPGTYFNTTELDHRLIHELGERSEVPNLLQRLVVPKVEYRAYVLYGRCLAVEIHRSNSRDLPVDLRVIDQEHLSGKECRLEDTVVDQLVALTAAIGLDFCAFDLIEDDQIYLVDINPVGGWYYIERKYAVNVSAWVVSTILEGGSI